MEERNYILNLKAINTPLDLLEVLSLLGIVEEKHRVIRMTDEQYITLSKQGMNHYFSVLHKPEIKEE